MAFNLENLSIATNSLKAGVVPSLWTYYNESNDAVTVTSYFAETRLVVGDQIMVYLPGFTASALYRVSAVTTTGLATVTASTSSYQNVAAIDTFTCAGSFNTISPSKETSLITTAAAAVTETFTAVAATDIVTAATNDLTDGIVCTLTTAGTLPAGLSLATSYYMVSTSGKTCKLSATLGGAAIDITDAGTGVHTINYTNHTVILADGNEGERKLIKLAVDGGIDVRLLPTNLQDGTTVVMADALDVLNLAFANGSWQILFNQGGTVAQFKLI